MNFSSVSKMRFEADGKPIVNELTVIDSKIAQLKENQKQLTKNTKEWTESAAAINKLKAEADEVRNSMGIMGMTMSQLSKLQIELNKEFKEFGTNGDKLKDVNTRLAEWRNETKSTFKTVNDSQGMWGNLKGWIVGAFTIAAVLEFGRAMIEFGKSVFDVGAKFEKYQVVLTKAFGSQELAKKSMAELQKLAAQTPFTLDELTGSYVKFVNRGLMPSMESMTKMGDVAASQGKSFDQLTEAILDAGTGEFERLKEFGIKAKKSGDQVELSFKGVHKTVKMTPEAMQGAIESFGELKSVSGMMAETMKTGEGTLSNINDKIDAVKVELYNGLTPVFRTLFSVVNTGWDIFRGFAGILMAIPNFVRENKAEFISLGIALVTLNTTNIANTISVIAHSAAEKARAFWTGVTNTATMLLNATVRANPVMAMVSAVMLVVTAFVAWYNRSETLRANLAGLWEMLKVLGTAFFNFYSALLSFNPTQMAAAFTGLGDKLSKAFNKGYDDSMKVSKAAAALEKQKEDAVSKKAAAELAAAEAKIAADAKAAGLDKGNKVLSDKEQKHRDSEGKKAIEAAEKLAKEELDIRIKAADDIDKIWFESIIDKEEKARLAIQRQYENEWEKAKNLNSKMLLNDEKFAELEIQLAKKRDAELAKLEADRTAAIEKAEAERAKIWATALSKKGKDIEELGKKLAKDALDEIEAENIKSKNIADRRKEMFQSLLGFVNDSFNDTIQTLESIDSAYAQSQANRIKAVQAGFQQISTAVGSLKLDTAGIFDFVKGDGAASIGSQLGDNIATGIKDSFTANPIKFIAAAKKIVDGINGVFEANRWAKFEAPLRKIIDDSIAAIEDMAKTLEIKMDALRAEGDKLLQQNDSNRDKLTAAALDYEAKQFAMLVKSQEDLNRINAQYLEEELRIKSLYAEALNSQDIERAAEARAIVDGLIRDLKVSRNDELESLITTENTKRDIQKAAADEVTQINKDADAEIAQLEKTATERTLLEQQTLIAAVEEKRRLELEKVAADRQAELTKLGDYKAQEAEINRLADEAVLAAKKANNDLAIAEQERLVAEIEAKRALDLANLATSDLGILDIKKQTAASIKAIEEASAAETFRIDSELKTKQAEAQREHSLQVYAAQLASWQAEKELTIAMLTLQFIKAQGKIFNKAEMKAILAALDAAKASLPPMPPAGLFQSPSGGGSGGSGGGGGGIGGADNVMKYQNGGFFPMYGETKAKYANGGVVYGPSHSAGGFKVVNSETGMVQAEMEGGEFIINKRATASNMALLSQINNSGIANRLSNSNFNRTGRPYYEDGGIFSTFGPITLNQSNNMAAETVQILNSIAKATGATAKATETTAKNTDETAKATSAALEPAREAAMNSRNLGGIASATRDTANKNFAPNISIINQQLGRLADIEKSARI